ncbi:hypothetical protein LCGC14_1615570, partial [marine sediment metagenome]
MNSLAFVYLTRDAGPTFAALAQDIAALARPGDRVVLVDDGSGDDTVARIGHFTAFEGWGPGVAVSRIVTGAPASGDLGIAVNLALSARNRSASIRIPMYSSSPKAKRLEFRCPDPTANGYLAWPAMMMAVLDGIEKKT